MLAVRHAYVNLLRHVYVFGKKIVGHGHRRVAVRGRSANLDR
jgi:hypothetical protein